MMKVKICGITREKDAKTAVECGAWAIGFVFYKKSQRVISPEKAKSIVESLPPFITPVGVFVNEQPNVIRAICEHVRINTIQLHGDETPAFCKRFPHLKIIKAFRVTDDFNFHEIRKYQVDAYLFDTYQKGVFGGSGKAFRWELLRGKRFQAPFILSGGLNNDNIKTPLRILSPYAVDISTGVETSPGIKDPHKIYRFFAAIKR